MALFQEQVAEQEAALARLEREKIALEKDKTRVAGLLNAEKAETVRLQAALDQRESEIAALERKLATALTGQDGMAELRRAREEADEALKVTLASLEETTLVSTERLEKIAVLQSERDELALAKTDLEAELAPMRPIVAALKDRLDADRRIAAEAKKL